MAANAENLALVRRSIRDIPDYPKPGILFKDITPMLKDPEAFRACIDELIRAVSAIPFDYVLGIESRGFILGGAMAYRLNKGFIPARKKGKLPYKVISHEYTLEYGTATLEMHQDALEKGSKVLIVDDLLATGGTVGATAKLVEQLGGVVTGIVFVVELDFLKGREKLKGYNLISLVKY